MVILIFAELEVQAEKLTPYLNQMRVMRFNRVAIRRMKRSGPKASWVFAAYLGRAYLGFYGLGGHRNDRSQAMAKCQCVCNNGESKLLLLI